jgi:hypothetical protein
LTAGGDRVQWSWPLARRSAWVAALCLLVGGGLGYTTTHQPAPKRPGNRDEPRQPEEPPAAGPAELALLAPLEAGRSLDDCAISRIEAVCDGKIAVVCAVGSATIELDVWLASPTAPPAPATSGPYAVYYSAEPSASASASRLALSLARVLGTHASQPRPDGLTPFRSR